MSALWEAARAVQRILVIQDVGLWIDLNRRLSGVVSVDLFEALSFETGQILAQIERPKVVVYGTAVIIKPLKNYVPTGALGNIMAVIADEISKKGDV